MIASAVVLLDRVRTLTADIEIAGLIEDDTARTVELAGGDDELVEEVAIAVKA
jgi:hypothetical protein